MNLNIPITLQNANDKKLLKGFTLVELVVSITIIAIAVLGTMLAINTAAVYSGDPMISYQAISIAESYLEEITQKSFPGTCPGSPTRANYTNIICYNGLSQAPTDQNGNLIAGLGGYTVTVAVNTTTAQLGSPSLTAGTQVVRIDVTVSHNQMPTMTYSAYRTNY